MQFIKSLPMDDLWQQRPESNPERTG